jgi:homospermidine synthase
MADYFTVKDKSGNVTYRPTVHYAYHPCDAAVLSIHETGAQNLRAPTKQLLMVDEIVDGIDELGVLLMGHKKGAYWFGSQLSIGETRKLIPYNNATSLQVSVAVLAGVQYAMNNPRQGVVEPDHIPFRPMMVILSYIIITPRVFCCMASNQCQYYVGVIGYHASLFRSSSW